MRVAIIMGSTSDLPKVEPAIGILKEYGVAVDVRCLSAHRAHAGLSEFIEEANNNGTQVIITAAGMAAALPGCSKPDSDPGYRSTNFRFCIRWNGCTSFYRSDAIRYPCSNCSNKRKQECSISGTSDHRKQQCRSKKETFGRA